MNPRSAVRSRRLPLFFGGLPVFFKVGYECKKNCGSVGESNCGHQQSKLASQPLRYPCTLVPLCFPYNSTQSLRLDYLITFSNSYGSQIWTEAYVDHNNNISCYKFFCYKFRVQMWWQFVSNIKCLTWCKQSDGAVVEQAEVQPCH